MNKEERKLYEWAIKQWGSSNQMIMMFEECGELINAIAKYNRGRSNSKDIITELADVSIMVNQLAVLFGEDDFIAERKRKLERLEDRLNKQQ